MKYGRTKGGGFRLAETSPAAPQNGAEKHTCPPYLPSLPSFNHQLQGKLFLQLFDVTPGASSHEEAAFQSRFG